MAAETYAGFWKRFAAAIIDGIVTGIGGLVVAGPIIALMILSATSARGEPDVEALGVALDGVANLLGLLLGWIYSAAMESSSLQATLGKMALQIKVTDLDGARVSFGKATGRHFAKFVSALLLFAGFVMAAFTAKKQGLHDLMAGCLVVNK